MKTMKYFLSMAALALVGAMTVSCSSDDNIIDQAQQPATNAGNVEILTTTVSLGGDGATRALTAEGVKTFAEGDQMAIYYWKNKGTVHEKAVSAPLTAGDITNGGKSATFTFTLDNPYKDMSVVYTYPAAMANADFTPNYDALYNNQDGTLATLASNFDFCTGSRPWNGDNLPSVTLVNQLAILAINLKNGSTDITSNIRGMTLSDGTNTYTVSRSAVAGPIYVAIRPTTGATINVTATDGSKNYGKTLATTKTYAAGNGYNVTWNMTDASVVSLAGRSEGDEINVSNGETITGTLTDGDECLTYATINIADGAIVTLKNVGINPDGDIHPGIDDISGITCAGNATIILEGTNIVNGFDRFGIEVKSGYTLTILGTGTLNASGYSGAGIGGEGNIVINGGNITATGGEGAAGIGGGKNASCGNIVINSGGTITATGGNKAAGIGSGFEGTCGNITISGGIVEATGGSEGNQYGAGIGSGASCSIDYTTSITITSGVTSVTATRGGDGGDCKFIGAGSVCSGGATLTIDGVADATTSSTFTNFNSSVSGNTWTLTHK